MDLKKYNIYFTAIIISLFLLWYMISTTHQYQREIDKVTSIKDAIIAERNDILDSLIYYQHQVHIFKNNEE